MFGFHLFLRDETFDYFKDELPPALHSAFGDQLDRARAVLADRTPDQLAYAFDSLDWLLRRGSDDFLFPQAMASAESGRPVPINRVKALKALMPNFDLTGQQDLPNATWADYFAVLALALVGEELYTFNNRDNPKALGIPPDSVDSGVLKERLAAGVFGSAVECMDAVAFAEQLQATADLNADASDQKSQAQERGRKGGKARVARFNELRVKVTAIYAEKYTRRSNRQAARHIWKNELSEADRSVLTAEEPEATLAKWIGRHVKKRAD